MQKSPALLLFLIITFYGYAQERFVNPIQGVLREDFIIVNYVDWGPAATVIDNHCLSKSYNEHQGTDYVLQSFRAMDEGVNVLAVDTGVVIFTLDGEFDREKVSDPSKGLGNYIGITHTGDFQTYYGHLKKNSIVVDVGDTVYPGEVIAQVASSGNSSDPHLHFELWYDSTFYIDPYSGPCGNAGNFWIDPFPFDSSFSVWHSHTWNGNPYLDILREAPLDVDSFTSDDSLITYWGLLHGLRNGDSLTTNWYSPDDSLWQSSGYQVFQDWWYYYEWSYLMVDSTLPSGEWYCVLHRNDIAVDTQNFVLKYLSDSIPQDTVITDTAVGIDPVDHQYSIWLMGNALQSNIPFETEVVVFGLDGRRMIAKRWKPGHMIPLSSNESGLRVVQVFRKGERLISQKIVLF